MKPTKFAGNDLSRTAILNAIASVANHKLTTVEMNKFNDVNHRSLERVYDKVVRMNAPTNALFALKFILE